MPAVSAEVLDTEGVLLSSLVTGDPLTSVDRTYMLQILTTNYGPNYFERDTELSDDVLHAEKALLLFEMAQKHGFGSRDFRAMIVAGVAANKYPSWNVADFFAAVRMPRVYGHGWYIEQCMKHRGNVDLIGTYDAGGSKPVFGWRRDVDGRLPRWKSEQIREPRELRDPRESMSDETRSQFREMMEKLRKETVAERAGDAATTHTSRPGSPNSFEQRDRPSADEEKRTTHENRKRRIA